MNRKRASIILLLFILFCLSVFFVHMPAPTSDFQYLTVTEVGNFLDEPFSLSIDGNEAAMKVILSQKYTYKSEGTRSAAFISEDNRYILKLFKRIQGKKIKSLRNLMNGYRIAYERNQEGTGTLFLHLEPSQPLPDLVLIDKDSKVPMKVKIHKFAFVIQKNAVETKKILSEAFKDKDFDLAKTLLKGLFSLYLEEFEKRVIDNDHNILVNSGFIDGKAIRFDASNLKTIEEYERSRSYAKLMSKIQNHLSTWLKKNAGAQYDDFHAYIVHELAAIKEKGDKVMANYRNSGEAIQ